MLLILLRLGSSIWWKFSSRQFDEKVKSSHKTPLFTLLYRPSCEHCHGHPEKIRAFHDKNPNRADVFISHINCDIEHACLRFPVESYPTYVLVAGEKPRYWQTTHEANPVVWEQMIERLTNFKMDEAKSDADVSAFVNRSLEGGTVFYIQVPKPDHPLIGVIQNEIKKFIFFNDSFVFRVVQNISEPEIYAYRSPFCKIKFDGLLIKSEIVAFFNDYRFGHLHRYDEREMLEETSARRTVILFEWNAIPPERLAYLENVSRLFCTNTSLGWLKYRQSNSITKVLGLNATEFPTAIMANRETQCISSFNISDTFSLRASLSSQLCMPRFKNFWGTALIHMKMKGREITWISASIGLGMITLIRLYESYASKDD